MSRKTDSLFQNYNRVQAEGPPKRSPLVVAFEVVAVAVIAAVIFYLLWGT
jgi:hypothetical protein